MREALFPNEFALKSSSLIIDGGGEGGLGLDFCRGRRILRFTRLPCWDCEGENLVVVCGLAVLIVGMLCAGGEYGEHKVAVGEVFLATTAA